MPPVDYFIVMNFDNHYHSEAIIVHTFNKECIPRYTWNIFIQNYLCYTAIRYNG